MLALRTQQKKKGWREELGCYSDILYLLHEPACPYWLSIHMCCLLSFCGQQAQKAMEAVEITVRIERQSMVQPRPHTFMSKTETPPCSN